MVARRALEILQPFGLIELQQFAKGSTTEIIADTLQGSTRQNPLRELAQDVDDHFATLTVIVWQVKQASLALHMATMRVQGWPEDYGTVLGGCETTPGGSGVGYGVRLGHDTGAPLAIVSVTV